MKCQNTLWIPFLLLAGCTTVPMPEYAAKGLPVPAAVVSENGDAGADADGWVAADPVAGRSSAITSDTLVRFAGQPNRRMAFTAALQMSVDDADAALKMAQEINSRAGGYTQEVDNFQTTLKVPLGKAEEVLEKIEKLGTVTSRRISGEDLTDQLVDLDVRFKNMETLRARLTALLAESKKVEDTLKIEQELNRVTTDLERLQAQLKNANNRVAYVDMTVSFNASDPQPAPRISFPVPWIARLGSSAGKAVPTANGCDRQPFEMELPPDFVAVSSDGVEFNAVSADDCVLRLTRRDDLKGGSPAFWGELIKRSLSELNNYTITGRETFINHEGIRGELFTADRNIGRSSFRYQLLFFHFGKGFLTDNELYLVEFWGPADAFDLHAKQVKEVYDTVDLSIWH